MIDSNQKNIEDMSEINPLEEIQNLLEKDFYTDADRFDINQVLKEHNINQDDLNKVFYDAIARKISQDKINAAEMMIDDFEIDTEGLSQSPKFASAINKLFKTYFSVLNTAGKVEDIMERISIPEHIYRRAVVSGLAFLIQNNLVEDAVRIFSNFDKPQDVVESIELQEALRLKIWQLKESSDTRQAQKLKETFNIKD